MRKIATIILILLGTVAAVSAFVFFAPNPLTEITGYGPNPPLKLAPIEGKIYHAMSPHIFTGWSRENDPRIFDETAELVGKDLAWVSVSNAWFPKNPPDDCLGGRAYPSDLGIRFPREEVEAVLRAGHIPSIRMLPYDRCISLDFEEYRLQTFLNGVHDEALRAWAREAKTIPSPLLVTFGVEVNGAWFPWNARHNGDLARKKYGDPNLYDGHERFRDVYRRIINIFREEGVRNVTWFYHVNCIWPSEERDPISSVDGYYPGDDYIDWIAISCYGSQDARNPFWWDMSYTFDRVYELINASEVIGRDKPIALMEFGVAEDPRKPAWIETFMNDLVQGAYPRIRAIGWWDSRFCIEYGEEGCRVYTDLRVNSSPASLEMYRSFILRDIFVGEAQFVPRW